MRERQAAQLQLVPEGGHAGDQHFIRLIREVVDALGGPTLVAGKLDLRPSLFENALRGENYNHIWGEHVPWFIQHDKSGQLIRYLNRLVGLEARPVKPVTDAEKVAAWERVIAKRLPYDADRIEAEVVADAIEARESKGDE